MVGHQREGVNLDPEACDRILDCGQKETTVLVSLEDRLSPRATVHHVVPGSGVVFAGLSCHDDVGGYYGVVIRGFDPDPLDLYGVRAADTLIWVSTEPGEDQIS
jgi:hypothetical protein